MSESRQRRDQTLADFTDLIRNVSHGDTFNLAVVLEKVHLLDAWPLFTVSVGPNEKSAQDINVARVISLFLPFSGVNYPVLLLFEALKHLLDIRLIANACIILQAFYCQFILSQKSHFHCNSMTILRRIRNL